MKKIVSIFCLIILLASSTAASAEDHEWKAVYISKLNQINEEERIDLVETSRYLIYDIDGNGIPELIISKGYRDSDIITEFYTCEENELIKLDELKAGYVIFNVDDMNKKFVIFHRVEDGNIYMQILLEKNRLSIEVIPNEEAFSISLRYLKMFGLNCVLPIIQYETICDFLAGKFPTSEKIFFPYDNNIFYDELFISDGMVQVVPDSISFIPAWQCPFSNLQRDGYEISTVRYVDLNGDGELECILDYGRSTDKPFRVFLCEQDGIVYAYIHEFAYEDISIDRNGNIISDTEGYKELHRLIFDKNDWFLMQLPLYLAE